MSAAISTCRATIVFCVIGALAMGYIQPAEADDEFLKQYAETYRFTLGHPATVKLSERGDAVLFLRSGPRSFVRDLYEFDVATNEERLLASANELLQGEQEQLTAEELARRERMRSAARGIAEFEVSRDGRQVLLPLSGSLYVLDRATGKSRELKSTTGYPIDARFSPDGKKVACVRNGELHVIDIDTSAEQQLTHGANETLTHGLAEFVAQEEMSRMHGYWWSPDSDKIVYQQTDTSNVEQWYISDPSHPGREPVEWRYPRPGKENARVRLGIVSATGGETTWIDWDQDRYPYLAAVTWDENAPLTILVQNREQTEEVLLSVDPITGSSQQLLKEADSAWINLDHAMPRWLEDGKSFLWTTERNGGWQLELRRRDGSLAATLTSSELGYRELVGVDESNNAAFVLGGSDPTQSQLLRVSLKGDGPPSHPVVIASDVRSAVYSKRGGTSVRTMRSLKGEVRRQVLRGDGSRSGELKSVAEKPPFVPNIVLTIVGDEPRLHAAIVRPREFDVSRRYPVIVNVYGGPGAQMVVAEDRDYLLNQWIADHGFIVVRIDGRGTPARGREWERAIKGNMIALPLEDQIRGLQALGEKYDEMDLSRVGIYGWSFGGYFSAHAVMQRPDIFDVGIAGAPVADFRDYDTHYTERYLGMPVKNREGYDASSALSYVSQLRRPLLIIHGTADDNVYFLHSMKLCDALFRAGKQYDFLPLTGFTHMVPDPIVTERLYDRMAEYFVEHLQPQVSAPTEARVGR